MTAAVDIAVVDSGTGNLRSVAQALSHVGGKPVVTSDPDVVRRAARIVVPGQGAFADTMRGLRERGLEPAVREVIAAGRPYFGMCLGLQVLFDESEEHGPVPGLGILPGRVVRLRPARHELKIPHMGWNAVRPPLRGTAPGEPLWRGLPLEAYVYFVHSYVVVPQDPAMVALTCEYGEPFCAAVRWRNVFATQFHPEKSQAVGLALLSNFVRGDGPEEVEG